MDRTTRRIFIHRLTFLGGGVVLLGGACKCNEPGGTKPATAKRPPGIVRQVLTTSHRTFTNPEFAIVSALAERILPRDEDPGAIDANVPEYIDRMLQSPDLHQMKEDFLGGIEAIDRRARARFGKGFTDASAAEQDELIAAFKDAPPDSGEAKFYELLLTLTLEGFLGDPSYGGNKDYVGWALVGFQTTAPPPGYDGMKLLHQHHAAMHAGHDGEP
ncbi:MAG: gluconate 2-dehydrogenase subunit 3 family protein [Myxococcaceae bacterium]|nr:gluconate 2-dehydrogenase subunit 3 family protein [Myxococcaceae bacterium]